MQMPIGGRTGKGKRVSGSSLPKFTCRSLLIGYIIRTTPRGWHGVCFLRLGLPCLSPRAWSVSLGNFGFPASFLLQFVQALYLSVPVSLAIAGPRGVAAFRSLAQYGIRSLVMGLQNVDYFYFDGGSYGWSERYYNTADTPSDTVDDAFALLAKRIVFLPTAMVVQYVRISTPGLPPNSLLLVPTTEQGTGTYAQATGTKIMPVDVRVLYTLIASDTLKNRKFLGGLISSDTTGDQFTPTDTWNTAEGDFATALIDGNWVAASTYKVDETQTQAAITDTSTASALHYRKAGRPFGQLRGRRRTVH